MKYKVNDIVIITPHQLTLFGEEKIDAIVIEVDVDPPLHQKGLSVINSQDKDLYRVRYITDDPKNKGKTKVHRESEIELNKQLFREKRLNELLKDKK